MLRLKIINSSIREYKAKKRLKDELEEITPGFTRTIY